MVKEAMENTTFLVTHPMLPSLDLERTTRFYQDHEGLLSRYGARSGALNPHRIPG